MSATFTNDSQAPEASNNAAAFSSDASNLGAIPPPPHSFQTQAPASEVSQASNTQLVSPQAPVSASGPSATPSVSEGTSPSSNPNTLVEEDPLVIDIINDLEAYARLPENETLPWLQIALNYRGHYLRLQSERNFEALRYGEPTTLDGTVILWLEACITYLRTWEDDESTA